MSLIIPLPLVPTFSVDPSPTTVEDFIKSVIRSNPLVTLLELHIQVVISRILSAIQEVVRRF